MGSDVSDAAAGGAQAVPSSPAAQPHPSTARGTLRSPIALDSDTSTSDSDGQMEEDTDSGNEPGVGGSDAGQHAGDAPPTLSVCCVKMDHFTFTLCFSLAHILVVQEPPRDFDGSFLVPRGAFHRLTSYQVWAIQRPWCERLTLVVCLTDGWRSLHRPAAEIQHIAGALDSWSPNKTRAITVWLLPCGGERVHRGRRNGLGQNASDSHVPRSAHC